MRSVCFPGSWPVHWFTSHSQSHRDQVADLRAHCPLNSAPLLMLVLSSVLWPWLQWELSSGASLLSSDSPSSSWLHAKASARPVFLTAALKSHPATLLCLFKYPIFFSEGLLLLPVLCVNPARAAVGLQTLNPLLLSACVWMLQDCLIWAHQAAHRNGVMEERGRLCSQRGAQRGLDLYFRPSVWGMLQSHI